jgi:hypothetical protein
VLIGLGNKKKITKSDFPNLVSFKFSASLIFMLLGFEFTSHDLTKIERLTPEHSKILSHEKATIRKQITPKYTTNILINIQACTA